MSMIIKPKYYILCLLLLLLPFPSFAKHNFVATIGVAKGGEPIVEKNNSSSWIRVDGSDKLRAGTGLQAEFGYQFELTKNTGVSLLTGYKYNDVNFTDTWHKIRVNPTSFLFYHRIKRVSYGGGLTYHINPTYSGEVRLNNPNIQNDTAKFDNALGFSALFAIRLTRSDLLSLEFRYTHITYKGAGRPINSSSTDRSKSTFDASNLSLLSVFRF